MSSANIALSTTDTSLSSASYQRSHCERHLGKIITAIALAAIALLMSGGLLYHFHVLNLLSSCCLMEVGALLIITAGVVASMQAYQFSEKMRIISEELKGTEDLLNHYATRLVDLQKLIYYLKCSDEEAFSFAVSHTMSQCKTFLNQESKLAPWKEVFYEICSLMVAEKEKKFTSCLSKDSTYRQFVFCVYNLYMLTEEEIDSWALEPTRFWTPSSTQLQIFKLIMTNEHFFSTKHQDSSTIRFDYWLDRRYYWLHQYHLFIDRLLFFDINSLQEVLYNVILLNKKAFKEIFDWILKGCLDTKGAWALRAYINTKNVVFQDEKKAIYWIERLEMVTDIINEHFAAIGHKNPEEDFLSDRYFGMLGVHFRFGMCLIYAYAKSLNIPQLAEKKDYFATMIRRYYSLFEGSIKYILDDLDTPTREAFCALDLEIPSHAENLSEDKNSQ